jgi:hypothetical protein
MPYEFKNSLSDFRLLHHSLLLQFIFNECSIEQVYQLGLWIVKTPGKSEGDFLSQKSGRLPYSAGPPGFITVQTKRHLTRLEVAKQGIPCANSSLAS